MTTTPSPYASNTRSLFGLRRRPGRVALILMRTPRPLYRHGWGWLLGHTFLLIAHQGRKTGKRRETVAMALTYDPDTRRVVIFSAWGPNTEWIRNLRAHPAVEIQIGRERYVPAQHFLSEDEAVAVAVEFRRHHPHRLRLFATDLRVGRPRLRRSREGVRSQPTVRGVLACVGGPVRTHRGDLTAQIRHRQWTRRPPPHARRPHLPPIGCITMRTRDARSHLLAA